jgi:hypothetical protein
MIIFLGRRLPGASSDLPEGRNGPGRSVCIKPARRCGCPLRLLPAGCTAPLFGLAPDGVYRARPVTRPAGELLPHRFTLTAAEAQAPRPRRFLFCGTIPIRNRVKQLRTVGVTHHRALWSPDFPPRHVLRCKLSGRFPAPLAQTEAPRRSSRPPRTSLYTVRRGRAAGNSLSDLARATISFRPASASRMWCPRARARPRTNPVDRLQDLPVTGAAGNRV